MAHAVLKESEPAYIRNGVSTSTFQIISQYSKIPVERMEFDDFVLVFNSPYKINVRQENEYFIHEDPLLDMTCWGKTLEELFDAVFEEFHFLWKDIALEENEKLHESAQRLKQILLIIAKEEKIQ
jgi:predicted RNase H-like HicB family nuclease